MRIALLNPCYWPQVRRGSERFVHDLSGQLLTRGHQVRLITAHRGRSTRRVEGGLEVERNRRPPDELLHRAGFEDYLTHVPLSYRSLMRGSDDIAHALFATDAGAAAAWARRRDRPWVYSHMGIATRWYLHDRRLRWRLTETAARGADATVALSQAAAESLRDCLGVEPRVIPPGVDLDTFSPGGERASEPTVVCAAALDAPQKRVSLLIEAMAIVRLTRPSARLVLSRPRDLASAAGLGGAEWIELRNLDDRVSLVDAYREAWVSALPSVGEAFGLVLAEALACGTPGVGTRIGGIAEVLDRDTVSRLFDDGEGAEGLARALLEAFELAQDPSTAQACRERAEEFGLSRFADRYEALYRELLDGR